MQMPSLELTDERIDGILKMTRQFDPAKAEEYEKLRQTDPEALKAKIREDMQNMRNRMMRGGPGGATGPGGPGGFGGPGGRQGRRNRSAEDGPGGPGPQQAPEGQNDR